MKKLLIIPAIFMITCSLCVKAQNIQPSLNQVELMKKFIGTWQQEGTGIDTINEFEMHEYNNAIMQTNSGTIRGVKTVQYMALYTYDPAFDSYKCFSLVPNGQSSTWRAKFSSDKEVNFDRVKDLKTNTVMFRTIDIFEDADHLTAKNYNPNKLLTGSSKWVRTSVKKANKASDLIGTYEYYGDRKGMSVWNENYFVWALENKSSITGPEITQENRIKSLNVAGGTWTRQDSIVTCVFKYNIDPKLVGTSFRFVYTLKGNFIESSFINEEGKVTRKSSAIKIN